MICYDNHDYTWLHCALRVFPYDPTALRWKGGSSRNSSPVLCDFIPIKVTLMHGGCGHCNSICANEANLWFLKCVIVCLCLIKKHLLTSNYSRTFENYYIKANVIKATVMFQQLTKRSKRQSTGCITQMVSTIRTTPQEAARSLLSRNCTCKKDRPIQMKILQRVAGFLGLQRKSFKCQQH